MPQAIRKLRTQLCSMPFPALTKPLSKGVYHKNNASRKVSPLEQSCKLYRIKHRKYESRPHYRHAAGIFCVRMRNASLLWLCLSKYFPSAANALLWFARNSVDSLSISRNFLLILRFNRIIRSGGDFCERF